MHRRLAIGAGFAAVILAVLFAALDMDADSGGAVMPKAIRSLMLIGICIGANANITYWIMHTCRRQLRSEIAADVAAALTEAVEKGFRLGMVAGAGRRLDRGDSGEMPKLAHITRDGLNGAR